MAALPIPPEVVNDNNAKSRFVREAAKVLDNIEHAMYGKIQTTRANTEVFVAPNPHEALIWMSKRISRTKLNRIIQHIYDHPVLDVDERHMLEVADSEGEDAAVLEDEAVDATSDEGDSRGKKRKRSPKPKTKRQINKALAENMNLAFTVANTQDWEQARETSDMPVVEKRCRAFAAKLPGVGMNVAARMISMALAVGTMDVFEEWREIILVWKRQNSYGRKLFQRIATTHDEDGTVGVAKTRDTQVTVLVDDSQATLQSQHPLWQQVDDAGLTLLETETFREKFFDAQKTRVDGMADCMRHRWKMDILYEEFSRLESEIRRRKAGTGGRGRRYDTVAKEHLFITTYTMDLGRRPTKDRDPNLWVAFGNYLDWGKRWNMLKLRFGSAAVFALLPGSANAFLEKYLSQVRVSQWIEMLADCNSDVARMVDYMEPLFTACMQETEPPPEFSFLEELDKLQGADPLRLLQGEGLPVDIESVSDEDNI